LASNQNYGVPQLVRNCFISVFIGRSIINIRVNCVKKFAVLEAIDQSTVLRKNLASAEIVKIEFNANLYTYDVS